MAKNLQAKEQNGAQLLVRALEAQGVTHVFDIPGAKIDGVFDALVNSKIETVVCRHEQNAAFIAGGIGRMTGKAGVAIATSGPGVSNLVTGLATANSEGDPVVALGGAVAISETLKQIHQNLDAVAICQPVTKFSATVGAPNAIAEVIANAFRAARRRLCQSAEGHHGGIVRIRRRAGASLLRPRPGGWRRSRGGSTIDQRFQILSYFWGCWPASPPMPLPCRTSSGGTTCLLSAPSRRPAPSVRISSRISVARVGQLANQPADSALESADLVVTIGYDPVNTLPPSGTGQVGASLSMSMFLTGQSRQLLSSLCRNYRGYPRDARGIRHRISIERSGRHFVEHPQAIIAERTHLSHEASSRDGTPIHPLRLVHELQQLLSADITLCLDMGSFHLWISPPSLYTLPPWRLPEK